MKTSSVNKVVGFILITLGTLIVMYVLFHVVKAILLGLPLLPEPIGGLPLYLGMLGNPFQTTRKVKVPVHSRKGHAERKTEALFKFIMYVTIGSAFILWLIQQLSQR